MQPSRLPKSLLFVAAAAVLIGVGTWVIARPPALQTAGAPSLDDRIDQILAAQQAQNERIDRLEHMQMAGLGGQYPSRGAINSQQVPTKDRDGADAVQREKARRAQAETAFGKEPVSATWASNTEAAVQAAFDPKNLQSLQSPAPLAYSSECRSSTCKIRITYSNETQAEIGEQFLSYNIGAKLPNAQWFEETNSDGSVQLTAFAHAPSGNGRR